jgi:hypothetical protein
MAQKSEAEFGIGADAVQAVFGDCLNLLDCVTAEVGKLDGFRLPKTCSVGLSSGA